MHCGHIAGLTPPEYQLSGNTRTITKLDKYADLQHEMWEEYIKILEENKPYDLCFSLGDLIDGRGEKSGGTELITSDRHVQCDMAVECFNQIRMRSNPDFKIIGVYGTMYHTSSNGEDWEGVIAEKAHFSKIGSHEWVDVNGCIFDLKHHVSSSVIPHGRHTGPARDALWNIIWSERGLQPRARFYLRGHAHYFDISGNATETVIVCPALQAMGSKYGGRVCSGIVDWGLITFDISDDGSVLDLAPHLVVLEKEKARALVV